MDHLTIRKRFLDFFSKRGHVLVSSSSLLPTDPSVLFTTAGMQQFKKYYTGDADPMRDFGSLNTVSIQKCIRTSDIDEVGDESHLTFFEMLGNFSFGGYFKKETIQYAHEFITKAMGLKIGYVSVFGGEGKVPADTESETYWKEIDPDIEVRKFGRADNFWGPTGDEGPCGPTSEIYVNGVEIWNLVFNQYYQNADKTLKPLKTPGIDTGMGLERLAMVAQGKKNIFETDLFEPIFKVLPNEKESIKRIITDHARAVVFLIADGIKPSNKEQGYVLRRLLRRAMVHLAASDRNISDICSLIIKAYKDVYPYLNEDTTLAVLDEEDKKFSKTITAGLKELNKTDPIDAKSAFKLYESYGLPYEIIKELGGDKSANLNREDFDEEFKKHQELSRTASAGMFKGGLADTNEQTTRLHTAAHLMLAGLRKVLGSQVSQKGSNITPERLRFDFNYDGKMTPEQIGQVEDFVNDAIDKKLPVRFEEVTLDEARAMNATGVFDSKYGERVKVYIIGPSAGSGQAMGDDIVSKEICGGPHVTNTGELASTSSPQVGKFKIVKEESASAGTRRIRAVLAN